MARNISTGTMGVAVLAIFVGLVGAYAVRAALQPRERPPAPAPGTLPLAAVDLPAGRVVALSDIRLAYDTSELRTEMSERNIAIDLAIPSPEFVIGRRLKGPLKEGEPFLTSNLYLAGTGPSVMERLKPGFRVYKLQVSNVDGGWVTAETRVDVLFRAQSRGGRETLSIPESTLTLLEDVEVLDVYRDEIHLLAISPPTADGSNVAQPTVRPRSTMTTVSLAVTPEQAVMLQAVEGRGELSLVARPETETLGRNLNSRKALTLEDILGIEPPTPPDPPFETEIYRRSRRQVNRFERDRLSQQSFSPSPPGPTIPSVDSGAEATDRAQDQVPRT